MRDFFSNLTMLTFLACGLSSGESLYQGEIMRAIDENRLSEITAKVQGIKEIELRIDAVDDVGSDWANFIAPVFVNADGQEISLTKEMVKKAQQRWGELHFDQNVGGSVLKIAGQEYAKGLGSHADAMILVQVPEDAITFKSQAGIDDGGAIRDGKKTVASVRFIVHDASKPYVKPMRAPEKVDLKYFTIKDDLEITVWASTPQLFNPTNMDIDHKGRIWVAEGVNYRGGNVGRRPDGDRITVIQDTNGDGVADSSHTFVQEKGLIAPLGVAVFDNKIYVSQPPSIIVYTDVDRDLKFDAAIDTREEILTGFNGINHDHSLHSVTAGPDGKFYFNSGNCGAVFTDKSGKTFIMASPYIHGSGKNAPSVVRAGEPSDDGHIHAAGFTARMDPDGSNVEIVGEGYRNSYEQSLSSYGNAFQSDNDDPPACRVSYILEYGSAGYFTRDAKQFYKAVKRPGQDHGRAHWRQDDPGTMDAGDIYGAGSPTGVTMYENGALGKNYVGTLFACEPGRNTIFDYKPEPLGATFKLDRGIFLTTGTDWESVGTARAGSEEPFFFRPSDITVGPDGALYVCDWYDPMVGGHLALDKSTSGTIYRIAPKGFKPQIPDFDLKTIDGAITALESPAINTRYLGFTALVAQGEKALFAVEKVLANENSFIAARAIWVLPHLGQSGKDKCVSLLKNDDPQIRLTAYRALRRSGNDMIPFAQQMAHDEDPGVRRDVALSLRDLPAAKTKAIFAELAKTVDPTDKNAIEAIGLGAANQESEIWLAIKDVLKPGAPEDWDERFTRLTWRLWPVAAVSDLKARAMSEKLTSEQRAFAVESLAFIDDRKSVDAMLELADKSPVKGEAASWLLKNGVGEWKKYNLGKELKDRGIYDPDTIQVTPVTVAAPAGEPKFSVEDVVKLTGDAEKGKTTATSCVICHQFNGVGPDYAPNLKDWGHSQPVDVIARAIIEPSAGIAQGYSGIEVTLKDRGVVHGLALNNGDPLIVTSTGGLTQLIPANRIAGKGDLKRSLMLSADQLGLSAQDVADLVAFLKKY